MQRYGERAVTCGTVYALVARGGSKGVCVGRGRRPYGLSSEVMRKADVAIMAGPSSVDMQLEDKKDRKRRTIQVETSPRWCPLLSPRQHASQSRPPPTRNPKKAHPCMPCSTDIRTFKFHTLSQWLLLINKNSYKLCLTSTVPCKMVYLLSPSNFDTRMSTDLYRFANHCCSQTKARIATTRKQGRQECMHYC